MSRGATWRERYRHWDGAGAESFAATSWSGTTGGIWATGRWAKLPTPAYAPIWNIESNRLEYLGPRTYPDLPVARAIRMAISLPLFVEPVPLNGGFWCDGGIVDIFPVRPILDIEPPVDAVVAINAFYPPGFAGEDENGWQHRLASIMHIARQVRSCQHVALARENLARLRTSVDVELLEPIAYQKVRATGFYQQFLDNRDWPEFMRAAGLRWSKSYAGGTAPGAQHPYQPECASTMQELGRWPLRHRAGTFGTAHSRARERPWRRRRVSDARKCDHAGPEGRCRGSRAGAL